MQVYYNTNHRVISNFTQKDFLNNNIPKIFHQLILGASVSKIIIDFYFRYIIIYICSANQSYPPSPSDKKSMTSKGNFHCFLPPSQLTASPPEAFFCLIPSTKVLLPNTCPSIFKLGRQVKDSGSYGTNISFESYITKHNIDCFRRH